MRPAMRQMSLFRSLFTHRGLFHVSSHFCESLFTHIRLSRHLSKHTHYSTNLTHYTLYSENRTHLLHIHDYLDTLHCLSTWFHHTHYCTKLTHYALSCIHRIHYAHSSTNLTHSLHTYDYVDTSFYHFVLRGVAT